MSEKRNIYLLDADKRQCGPFSIGEVRARLLDGEFTAQSLAWKAGMAEWVPLETLLSSLTSFDSPGGSSHREPLVIHQHYHVETPKPKRVFEAKEPPWVLIICGYVFAAVGLLFCPPAFAAAGITCGIIVLTKGFTGHGIGIIATSFVLGCFGMLIGAAMAASQHL